MQFGRRAPDTGIVCHALEGAPQSTAGNLCGVSPQQHVDDGALPGASFPENDNVARGRLCHDPLPSCKLLRLDPLQPKLQVLKDSSIKIKCSKLESTNRAQRHYRQAIGIGKWATSSCAFLSLHISYKSPQFWTQHGKIRPRTSTTIFQNSQSSSRHW